MNTMSLPATQSTTCQEPCEDAIRDYAYHLYEQGGCAPGHDVDNWLEASACLKANIPPQSSHSRLHQHVNSPAACNSKTNTT